MGKQFTHPFNEIRKRYSRLKPKLPALASNLAVNEFKGNFRRGGYRISTGIVRRWKPRKNKGKRNTGRAILVQSGRLKRSLRAAPIGTYARVLTNVPYAKAHNEGATGRVNIQGHTRGRYGKVRAKRNGKNKTLTRRNGSSYVRPHKRKQNLPKRPFMITTSPLLRDINKMVDRELNKIINRL